MTSLLPLSVSQTRTVIDRAWEAAALEMAIAVWAIARRGIALNDLGGEAAAGLSIAASAAAHRRRGKARIQHAADRRRRSRPRSERPALGRPACLIQPQRPCSSSVRSSLLSSSCRATGPVPWRALSIRRPRSWNSSGRSCSANNGFASDTSARSASVGDYFTSRAGRRAVADRPRFPDRHPRTLQRLPASGQPRRTGSRQTRRASCAATTAGPTRSTAGCSQRR